MDDFLNDLIKENDIVVELQIHKEKISSLEKKLTTIKYILEKVLEKIDDKDKLIKELNEELEIRNIMKHCM